MNRRKRPTFSPEFRLEAAQLVVDQGSHYTSRKFRQQLWRHQIEQSRSIGLATKLWPDLLDHYGIGI